MRFLGYAELIRRLGQQGLAPGLRRLLKPRRAMYVTDHPPKFLRRCALRGYAYARDV